MPRYSVSHRRELLVEAAFRVIARGGVEAATTRAICAEARMAQASFHYAFASRDELLAAVVARGTSDELAAVTVPLRALRDEYLDVTATIDEVLRLGMLAYFNYLVADPEREQAMIALSQYAQRTPGLESFVVHMYQRYYEIAAQALADAAELCGVTWKKPPSYLAPLVVSATDGLTMAYLATKDHTVSERIIAATVNMLCGYVVDHVPAQS